MFSCTFSIYNRRTVGGDFLSADYSPLWKTMKEKQVSQYALLKQGIDNHTLYNMKRNGNVNLATLEKLCAILDCTPNDVVQFVADDK